jgi:predicted ABC-type ATPase
MDQPNVVIMAGPNGAGKTTISKELLAGSLDIRHYVNADAIARGLSDIGLSFGRNGVQSRQSDAATFARLGGGTRQLCI